MLPVKNDSLARKQRALDRVHKVIELYQPFILDNEYFFAADNIRKLGVALSGDEMEDFGYHPENIDWYDYWVNLHVPALRRWTYPIIEGRRPDTGLLPRNFKLEPASISATTANASGDPMGGTVYHGGSREPGRAKASFPPWASSSPDPLATSALTSPPSCWKNTTSTSFSWCGLPTVKPRPSAFGEPFSLHLDFDTFRHHLHTGMEVLTGDLTEEGLGFSPDQYRQLVKKADSILHVAASLNRKSEKACLNINLRGTLEVVKLAQAVSADHGLKRFSHISTVAVAGDRQDEVVEEENAIDWNRSDYDPYARTKKFCEHLIRELLPETPLTIFRPSIVLGDSRRAETTQFDMVQAFAFLAGLPLLPLRAGDRLDIVNVDFVAEAVANLHQKESPGFDTYHLSSGRSSPTCQDITNALSAVRNRRRPTYAPSLIRPVNSLVNWLARRRGTPVGYLASLMQVFLPYLHWNTVFDNSRVVQETETSPARFTDYCYPLYQFATRNHFTYPYREWPETGGAP